MTWLFRKARLLEQEEEKGDLMTVWDLLLFPRTLLPARLTEDITSLRTASIEEKR